MGTKLHNPKCHQPAVYIPSWLIQVDSKLLSFAAKLLYGRLAQWCTVTGTVFRSCPQLSQELGCQTRVIERYLKELRECKLIETFQPQKGGLNHFRFLEHEWMNHPLNENLCYDLNPPTKTSVPPDNIVGTPPTKTSDININKIEINNNNNKTSKVVDSNYPETYFPQPKQTKTTLTIQTIQTFNPHNLPIEMIEDWIENRRIKKSAITLTAWKRINTELQKCPDPIAAFEEYVANGWVGFNVAWLEENKNKAKKSHFDNDSTKWADGIEKDIF